MPQNFKSVGAGTELGQMVDAIEEHNVADVLPRIREYVARHSEDAMAWDCLRRVCTLAGDHKQALDASLTAAQLAPNDGVIRYEAAAIYLAAVTNQIRSGKGINQVTVGEYVGCTLEVLGVSYEQAYSATWHHLEAAIESSMTGNPRQAAEMMVKFLRR